MEMIRRPDWRARLAAWLAAEAVRPFEYGKSDCALFAAGAVLAMTGIDLADGWRGRYTTLRGGLRVLHKAGHRNHVALTAARLPEIEPGRAQVGDIAVVEGNDGPSLGVVNGAWVAVRTMSGLGHVPRDKVVRAFKCG